MGDELRIPLHLLRVKRPVTAGMSPYVILGMVPFLRNTTEDVEAILVDNLCTPETPCGSWEIQDGRHRFTSHVMAGRFDIVGRPELG